MAHRHQHQDACCDHPPPTSLDGQFLLETDLIGSGDASRVVYSIQNMDCPTEEGLIRARLSGMEGIKNLSFNLMQRKLTVEHTLERPDAIEMALQAIGMQAKTLEAHGVNSASNQAVEHPPAVSKRKWWITGVAGVMALLAEILAWTSGNEGSWQVIVLAALAIVLSGIGTYKKGWLALKNFNLNINALMTIAVTGAVVIGQWPEAAMVMVLFTLAEMIEALSLDRARDAIRGLMALTPDTARILQADGVWIETEVAAVVKGALVRVAPGERIPLDGVLTVGQSTVNQAPITGESMPVHKTVGDQVFAGTINEMGSFDYRVTDDQGHSTLSRIIHAVQEAQGAKAPTQRFVDRFSKVYTPIVCLVALAVAIVPPLLLGQLWMPWVYKALVLLVIACPCALVISTPVTVVSALAAAAKAGILIKGGVYLEEGHKIRALALDKTGTITQGRPVVTDVVALTSGKIDGIQLAAHLASRSDHPVSTAISAYWKQQHPDAVFSEVDGFTAILGHGVKADINGQRYYLGNHRLIEELGINDEPVQSAVTALEAQGKTVVVISDDAKPIAVIAVADTVRDTSKQAIAELHALGVRTLVLSGDNQLTVDAIAKDVGIDDARGSLLPSDKLTVIDELLNQHGTVGMVGDGINDAPALAKASIGFAMGAAGTDTALETADVALMGDDLRKIPQFIRLSARASSVLMQNIVIALGIKAVFFVLAILGMATLWMAVFADMGASLVVVFNGLRLLAARQK